MRPPPTVSGNEVVAAAQIAPVGWNDSAWSTRPLWCTRSCHGPTYAWWSCDHDSHAAMVSANRDAISSCAQTRAVPASARAHTNAGTKLYLVGQPQYEAGHECSLAGTGGAKWTDDEAKKIRRSWEELKSVTEGFVVAAERGTFGAEAAPPQ